MSREAIYRDPEFPQEPRLIVGKELVESTMQSAVLARQQYESLSPEAGTVERFLSKSKVDFFTKLERSMQGTQENEARYFEAQHEYLQQHLQDTLKMLNSIEVNKLKMKPTNRRIVEG